MKKKITKFFSLFFAAVMFLSIFPLGQVSAASLKCPKSATVYMSDWNETWAFKVSGLSGGAKIKNIKSSNRNILDIRAVRYYDEEQNGKTLHCADVLVSTRTTGKTTVSFKVGKTSKKVKVAVKPYSNPVKTANIFGVKENNTTNLKKLSAKSDVIWLNRDSTMTNKKIKVAAASGWQVVGLSIWNDNDGTSIKEKWLDENKSSLTMNVKLPGEGLYCISVEFWNKKTKTQKQLVYMLNNY